MASSESETLWQAVRTIAIADAVMSLDNVVAIAAAAHGNVMALHLRPHRLDSAHRRWAPR